MAALRTSDFDYYLPPGLIAQTPVEPRDASRLMVLHRSTQAIEHRRFQDIGEYLRPGDLLVANQSRVIPARLHARKQSTGGHVELLLLRRREPSVWEALVKPGRRVRPGTRLELPAGAGGVVSEAEALERTEAGGWMVRFSDETALESIGGVPLPPYIHVPLSDPERYQTVYARSKGSVAAPTAGLHFTPELMEALRQKGMSFAFITLHIGLDTFRPVQEEDPERHQIHSEYAELSPEVADRINGARREGGRIIAVGTTAVRTLETAAQESGVVQPFHGWTTLFIRPSYRFQVVDAMITNFHLPRSTLLMLVSAFAGRRFILQAYAEAVREGYRFYSFGDATLIL